MPALKLAPPRRPIRNPLRFEQLDARDVPSAPVPNSPPVAVPDRYATTENATLTVPAAGLLANDTDPDGDPLHVTANTQPAHGTVTVNPDGSFTYTPYANYYGTDSFKYTVGDGRGGTAVTTVTIAVNAVTAPGVTVTGDSFLVAADNQIFRINSLTGAVIATYATGLANDGVAVAPNGNIYFADYANKRIRYYGPSGAPINNFSTNGLTPQGLAFGPDGNLYVTTTAGSVERYRPDGSNHATFIAPGSGGLNNAKGIVWGPDGYAYVSSYWNDEVLRYDGATGAFRDVFATGTGYGGFEDLTFGPDGNLYVASYGDGAVYRYRGSDGTPLGTFAAGILTPYGLRFDPNGNLQVSSRSAGEIRTYAVSGAYLGNLDTGLPNPAYITDTSSLVTTSAGATATFRVVLNTQPASDVKITLTASAPAQGSLSPASLNFTPADWDTPQLVTVTGLDDGIANGDQAYQITATVASNDGNYNGIAVPPVPVLNREVIPPDRPPAANADSYTTIENGTLGIPAGAGLLSNDTDPDGDPLHVVAHTNPAHGAVAVNADGSFTYTPSANYYGPDAFQYTVSDGRGGTANGMATLTVTRVNRTPVAIDDHFTMGGLLSRLTVSAPGVLGNDVDPDGDALKVASFTQPGKGTLALNPDGSFTYTPGLLFLSGTDTFTYTVTDGQSTSAPATVTIDVQLTGNQAPTAKSESYTTPQDSTLDVLAPGVLGNDSDPNGDTLSADLDTNVAHGQLILRPDGSFTYIPTAGYVGSDAFTYHATDGSLDSSSVTVSLIVTPVNHPPAAADDAYSTGQNTALTLSAPGLLANDADPDGDPLSVTAHTNPAHGTLTVNPDGSFAYTPKPAFHGTDSFTYRVSDPGGASSTATVTIRVVPPVGAPVAADDAFTMDEDSTLKVGAPGVLGNDTPPGNLPLTARLVSGPAHGRLVIRPDGSFVYRPDADYSGTDTFVYQAVDINGRASAPARVTVTVIQDEPAPVVRPDAFAVDADTTLQSGAPGVLANDTDTDNDPRAALVSGPAHGTLSLNADGSFTYMPAAGFTGTDTFIYRAVDGPLSSPPVTVTIAVGPDVAVPGGLVAGPAGDPIGATGSPRPTAVTVSVGPAGGSSATGVGHGSGGATGSPGPTILPLPPVVSGAPFAFGVGMPVGFGFAGPDVGSARPAVEAGPVPTVVLPPNAPLSSPGPGIAPPARTESATAAPMPHPSAPFVGSVVPPLPTLGSDNPVFTGLDELKQDVSRPKRIEVTAGTAVGTGMVMTAGTVLLSPRLAYWFLSAVLARRTVWKPFDPLEVVSAWEKEKGTDDDESLEGMVG